MNWDRVEGQWTGLKGKVRETWGKLTDDDMEQIAGKKDRLLGKLQERYGIEKDNAEAQVDEFIEGINDDQEEYPRH